MNKLLARLLIVCLALIALVPTAFAQTATESAGDNPLAGTSWQLIAIDGAPVIEGSTASLQFADGTLSGSGGCNRFNGSYTLTDSTLTVAPLVLTRMACIDDPVTRQESDYIGLLQAASSTQFSDDTLTLTTPDGKTLTFEVMPSDPLVGTQWLLVSYGPVDQPTPVIAGSVVSLGFDNMGYVYGSGGCNDIGGRYQVQGDKVAFGMITTDKACLDEAITKQESAFFDALASPVPFSTDGDTLTFQYGDQQQLVLKAVKLVGTQWQLVSYGPTDAPTAVISGSAVTLNFTNETQLAGNGGCNGYGGSYQVDGNQITISDVISTMMACLANGVTEQEQAYFAALQSASSYTISGDTLTLEDADGQLTFTRIPSPDLPDATPEATSGTVSS